MRDTNRKEKKQRANLGEQIKCHIQERFSKRDEKDRKKIYKNRQRISETKESALYDYAVYKLTRKEKVKVIVSGLGISGALAWVFYQSVFAMIVAVVVIPMLWKQFEKRRAEEKRKLLCQGFKDMLQSVSSAMQAGYSIENAWREAQKDIERLHGLENPMTVELRQMNAALRCNVSLERLLVEFASRSGCEEIISFCQVFQFAKRSGGDFIKIMRVTANHIQAKVETQQEIDTMLSGQRMEQKMMNVIPLAILGFLNVSGGGFLDVMYHQMPGILIMTVALVVYGGAIWFSQKIGDVKC